MNAKEVSFKLTQTSPPPPHTHTHKLATIQTLLRPIKEATILYHCTLVLNTMPYPNSCRVRHICLYNALLAI